MGQSRMSTIVTVTLNPAIDRVIEVDSFTIGEHQVGRERLRQAAGKGVNISRTLARMGLSSTATGFLGAESLPTFEGVFRDRRITNAFVTLPGQTRENITITDLCSRRETHIRSAGLAVDSWGLAKLTRTLEQLATREAVVIFSGSLPPGVLPSHLAALARCCLSRGARVAVDTSGPALSAVAELPLWVVKPNAKELSALVGCEHKKEHEQLADTRELATRFEHVLLTLGTRGAYLVTGGVALHGVLELGAEEIASTVGCGDVFLAAYIAGLRQDFSPREAFAGALAFGAACATVIDPAGASPDVATSLLSRVRIREV